MKTVSAIGVDISKNWFQLHGVDEQGRVCFRERLRRERFLPYMAQVPPAKVGMEACGSSQYWARELIRLGHDARLIAAQHVKPFALSAKNDRNDAAAICEVLLRPATRFVVVKTVEQQTLQSLIAVRERLVGNRTALVNQMRGLLAERGIVFSVTISKLRKGLAEALGAQRFGAGSHDEVLFRSLYEELVVLEQKLVEAYRALKAAYRENGTCVRLGAVPGIGPVVAVALVAGLGNASNFKNGRQLAASIGLVPRQHSSGDVQRLGSITKRGDERLRRLLVHGARAALRFAEHSPNDSSLIWASKLRERKGANKAAVALANKTARIAFHLLRTEATYRAAR